MQAACQTKAASPPKHTSDHACEQQTEKPAMAIHWFTGKFSDEKLERQFNAHAHPMWRNTNIAGLVIMQIMLTFNGLQGAADPVYIRWYGAKTVWLCCSLVIASPAVPLAVLLIQAWLAGRKRRGKTKSKTTSALNRFLSPRLTSGVLMGATIAGWTVLFVALDIIAVQGGHASYDELLRVSKARVPIELGCVWICLVGFQTEYRYKMAMLSTYLIGLRLLLRLAFCKDIFVRGDYGSTAQVFLSAAYIVDIRRRERMQKESYYTQRASHNKLNIVPTLTSLASLDSLHDRPPTMPAAAPEDDDINEEDTPKIPSRRKIPLPAWLRTYWRHLLDQRFKDTTREAAFGQYFAHALNPYTRLQCVWAFASAAASSISLIITYGLHTAAQTPGFSHIAIILPLMSLAALAITFIPSLVSANHPQRQQISALLSYAVMSVMAIYSSNAVIPSIQISDPAFDIYLGVTNFRLNLMMARASAPTLRGRYALVATLVVDGAATLIAFAQAGKLAHGMVFATLYCTVAAIAGLVISPWGEKAHRRYCRTVVWNQMGGAAQSSSTWAVDKKARISGPRIAIGGATPSIEPAAGACVRSANLDDVL
ncbi:hypothetical protein HDU88_007553 [Geranomyces variabilis]|nr:hypothetical protein HDU88_007553 [Geranomyces variabilis]